jgi:signal transduction protein with GAF and PtsI domain
MASDPLLAVLLLGLGARALSMASRYLPDVRAILGAIRLDQAVELAGQVMQLPGEAHRRSFLEEAMRRLVPATLAVGE